MYFWSISITVNCCWVYQQEHPQAFLDSVRNCLHKFPCHHTQKNHSRHSVRNRRRDKMMTKVKRLTKNKKATKSFSLDQDFLLSNVQAPVTDPILGTPITALISYLDIPLFNESLNARHFFRSPLSPTLKTHLGFPRFSKRCCTVQQRQRILNFWPVHIFSRQTHATAGPWLTPNWPWQAMKKSWRWWVFRPTDYKLADNGS